MFRSTSLRPLQLVSQHIAWDLISASEGYRQCYDRIEVDGDYLERVEVVELPDCS